MVRSKTASGTSAQSICLVIPTRNRPRFLDRLLDYYNVLGFSDLIIVADSSCAPYIDANRHAVASAMGDLRVQHQIFDNTVRLYTKIAEVLSKVDTEYAVICADDDFLVPEGVYACVDYLKNHEDYSAVQGLGYNFLLRKTRPGRWSFHLSALQHNVGSLSQDHPADRLLQHLSDYRPTFYAVHKRSELQRNMETCAKKTYDVRFGELLPSCLSVIQGKVKRLDVPFEVRECHAKQASPSETGWGELLVSDDFSERYVAFRECLTQELARIAGESEQVSREAVNRAALLIFGKLFRRYDPGDFSQRGQGDPSNRAIGRGVRQAIRAMPLIGPAVVYAKRFLIDRIKGIGDLSIIEKHVLGHADHIHLAELKGK